MNPVHGSLSPAGRTHYLAIWEQGVRYLTLKYANLPASLPGEDRRVMEAGIRRCLDFMLDELDAVDPGAGDRFRTTVHGLADVLGDRPAADHAG